MTPEERIAAFLSRRLPAVPRAAVVLGSGWDGAAPAPDLILPYDRIPGYPRSTVPGHAGKLTWSRGVAYLHGRLHLYEGRPMEEVVRPVRALARLGVKTLVLTNAAGGVSPRFRPGDLMVIRDHLNLMGANPLHGGARFVDLSSAYDPDLRRRARRAGVAVREGVYAAVAGPSYETPAEVRMLRRMGADAVGMSTVPEAIAAAGEGMRVLAVSCITNRAGSGDHREVLAAAARAQGRLAALLEGVLSDLAGGGRKKPS